MNGFYASIDIAKLQKEVKDLKKIIAKIIEFIPEPTDDQLLKEAGWEITSLDPFEIRLGVTERYGSAARFEVNELRHAYKTRRIEALSF